VVLMHEHGGGADPFFSHDGDMEKRRDKPRRKFSRR